MNNVDSWNGVALGMMSLVVIVVLYLWISLALAAVFRKSGEEAWKAWVPVLNQIVLLRLGGLSGWLFLLVLVPFFGAFALWVVTIIAIHRINAAFGFGAGMTVLGALLFPVWASVLGFGSARWIGTDSDVGPRRGGAVSAPVVPGAAGAPVSGSPVVSGAPVVAGTPGAPAMSGASVGSPGTPAMSGASASVGASPVGPRSSAGAPGAAPAAAFADWAPPPPPASPAAPSRPSVEVSSVPPVPPMPPRPESPVTAEVAAGETLLARPADAEPPAGPAAPSITVPPVVAVPPSITVPPAAPGAGNGRGRWGGFDLGSVSELTSDVTEAESGAPAPISAVPPVSESPPPSTPAVTRVPPMPPAPPAAPEASEADDEPWAPLRPPVESEAFPETSGPVSAVAGAPDAGAPRAARSSVSAAHTRPEIPEELPDETLIARRRRTAWSLIPRGGTPIQLAADVVILGRRPSPDPAYPRAQLVAVDDGTVSKTHARLVLREDRWYVTDLHSTNGVLFATLMGTEVEATPGDEVEAGERFFLGDAEMRLARSEP